jgi:hypothetical protein
MMTYYKSIKIRGPKYEQFRRTARKICTRIKINRFKVKLKA